jgi:hypothetical protein
VICWCEARKEKAGKDLSSMDKRDERKRTLR